MRNNQRIFSWVLIAVVVFYYLKETAFSYWLYLTENSGVEGVSVGALLPFLLFGIGAVAIVLGLRLIMLPTLSNTGNE